MATSSSTDLSCNGDSALFQPGEKDLYRRCVTKQLFDLMADLCKRSRSVPLMILVNDRFSATEQYQMFCQKLPSIVFIIRTIILIKE